MSFWMSITARTDFRFEGDKELILALRLPIGVFDILKFSSAGLTTVERPWKDVSRILSLGNSCLFADAPFVILIFLTDSFSFTINLRCFNLGFLIIVGGGEIGAIETLAMSFLVLRILRSELLSLMGFCVLYFFKSKKYLSRIYVAVSGL